MCMAVRMSMAMTARGAGVGAAFGFKRLQDFMNRQAHGAQHVRQYMVGLDFQVVGLELDGHMAVAQVVCGTGQVEERAAGGVVRDAQHRLGRRNHPDHGAIFGKQYVATSDQRAAWQKYAKLAAQRVGRLKAAFLAHIPVELDGRGAFDKHRRQAGALRN